MEVLSLKVRAPQVSFRRPLDLNYQRTFPLPPPTTLIGLAGAALGLADFEIWDKHPLSQVKVSALIDKPGGKTLDLMKVLKIKNNRIEQRSPYFREVLFDVEYTLIYGCNYDLKEMLKDAFCDPVYPLSLGREDELIDIVSIEEIPLIRGKPVFRGTAIPGDIRDMDVIFCDLRSGNNPIKLEPAIVESIPLKFDVKNNQRLPILKSTMTFLPYSLKIEIRNFQYQVYSIDNRNFIWMNS